MTSPSAAPGAGGRQQRPRPKSAKSGQPEGKTVGRRELSRHARFAEISPEVGILDERAMSQALADDPAAFELLAVMTTATEENPEVVPRIEPRPVGDPGCVRITV